MIDTVKLKYNVTVPEEKLLLWDCKATLTGGLVKYEKYVANIVLNPKVPSALRKSIKATYYAHDYSDKPHLAIELSVPKIVFGNNYQMVFNLKEAAEIIDKCFKDINLFPPLPTCRKATLGRLDACYNYQVGDNLYHYIKALSRLEYPHRRAADFKYQGVQFKSKHKTAKFYDKGVETRMKEAKGLLRQEATIMKTKNIQKIFKDKKPIFGNLSIEILKNILESDQKALKLTDTDILSADKTLEKIIDLYPNQKTAFEVFGIYTARNIRGKKYLANSLGTSSQKISRRLRQLNKAGIAPTITEEVEFLPPLVIDIERSEMNQSP